MFLNPGKESCLILHVKMCFLIEYLKEIGQFFFCIIL